MRAQTTIEFLTITSILILIALIITINFGTILEFVSQRDTQRQNIQAQQENIYIQMFSNGNTTLVIQNNFPYEITLQSIQIQQETLIIDKILVSGNKTQIEIQNILAEYAIITYKNNINNRTYETISTLIAS